MDGRFERVDKNFLIATKIEKEGLCFYDIEKSPFKIHGIFKEDGVFRRIPSSVARSVSEGVYNLHTHAAGGRVRFVSDSPYVAIKVEYVPTRMPHFALSGSAGFDMYSGYNNEIRYEGTFVPPLDVTHGYESVKDFSNEHERIITINFPLYSTVTKLYIGLKEGSSLKEAPSYKVEKPVVYYGSSITQGGCASKPSSTYQSILSRKFNCDFINLGFAGNARGEKEITDYIKNLDMSIFVLDYDHNAPSLEHLKNTHQVMFQEIRKANPNLPIIIMNRPKYYLTKEEKQRYDVIYATYMSAKEQGDKNVYFLSNEKLMEIALDNGTVDNCHPTDFGYFSMANALEEVFKEILSKL